MRNKVLLFALFLLLPLLLSISCFAQFSYYLRLDETEVRNLLAIRKIDGLGVRYTNDGQKILFFHY